MTTRTSLITRHRLTLRILMLSLLAVLILGLVLVWRAETTLERAMFNQAKSQAVVLLHGIEREITAQSDPLDTMVLTDILARATDNTGSQDFVVRAAYVYDRSGKVLAHEPPGQFPDKSMDGRYGDVIRHGEPYLGEEIEYEQEPGSPVAVPKLDIIIPIHHQGQIIAGLEIELDLGGTLAMVKSLDDEYEREIGLTLAFGSLLLLLFLSLLIYRDLIRPIDRIGKTTRQIANGDFDARVGHHGVDELGNLAVGVDGMAEGLKTLFDEQEAAYLSMLQSLSKALEAKDAYTAGHSGRVAHFSVLLGRRIGLSSDELKLLKQGALVHDLGKIGIPDAILNKPSALERREYEEMKRHPEYTHTIMRPLKRFKAFADIARWHHERWDGAGYPDGLAGEEIPLLARIVSIADTWDAMTGDRVYRKGMPIDKALTILKSERDLGQWDPELLQRFIALIEDEQEQRKTVRDDYDLGGVPA